MPLLPDWKAEKIGSQKHTRLANWQARTSMRDTVSKNKIEISREIYPVLTSGLHKHHTHKVELNKQKYGRGESNQTGNEKFTQSGNSSGSACRDTCRQA